VHQLLTERGIGHTVDDSGTMANEEQMIHVGKMWDVERVQDVLDSVP
jgi:hypothetical protein